MTTLNTLVNFANNTKKDEPTLEKDDHVIEGLTYTFENVPSLPIWVAGLIAQATHEVNRAWCAMNGDTSQKPWAEAPDWQKVSAVKGILGVEKGNGPEQSHESWLAEKQATGWKYGPVKDADKKEHHCFVEYSKLPPEQKIKDQFFVTTAKSLIEAYKKVNEITK